MLITSPVDFSLPFIPESLTSLAHTPVYATLTSEEKLAYNQAYALYVNEQTAYMELNMTDFMVAIANLPEARHLRCDLLRLVLEEERHAAGFLSLNRRLRPDLYAQTDSVFVRLEPFVSRWTARLLRAPKLFPFPIWIILLVEERSLAHTELGNSQSDQLEPNFVRLNQLHANDEGGHVALDENLIGLLWDSLPQPLKRLNAWLLGKVFKEFLYYPKRAALEILRVCFRNHPNLPTMLQQVLDLRHNRQFLATLYNRTTNPKTLKLMDRRPELAGMGRIMEGYR